MSVKSPDWSTLRCTTEKTISIGLSHEACMGRWTRVAVGQACSIRRMDACPAWEEPLSTTQNTRLADAYGSVLMTLLTRAANGAIPVVGATVPIRWARCTS